MQEIRRMVAGESVPATTVPATTATPVPPRSNSTGNRDRATHLAMGASKMSGGRPPLNRLYPMEYPHFKDLQKIFEGKFGKDTTPRYQRLHDALHRFEVDSPDDIKSLEKSELKKRFQDFLDNKYNDNDKGGPPPGVKPGIADVPVSADKKTVPTKRVADAPALQPVVPVSTGGRSGALEGARAWCRGNPKTCTALIAVGVAAAVVLTGGTAGVAYLGLRGGSTPQFQPQPATLVGGSVSPNEI